MATKTIGELPAAPGAPNASDLIEGERDPSGTPLSEKLTWTQVAAGTAFTGTYATASYVDAKTVTQNHVWEVTFPSTFDDASNSTLEIPIKVPTPQGTYTAVSMYVRLSASPTVAVTFGMLKNTSTEMYTTGDDLSIPTGGTPEATLAFDVTTLAGGDELQPYCGSIDPGDEGVSAYIRILATETITLD